MSKLIAILVGCAFVFLGFSLITKPFFYMVFLIMSVFIPALSFVDNFFANFVFITVFTAVPTLLYFYILAKLFEFGSKLTTA